MPHLGNRILEDKKKKGEKGRKTVKWEGKDTKMVLGK